MAKIHVFYAFPPYVVTIIAHNRSSGDLTPSKEDITVTNKVKEASSVLGLNLLDHIIFDQKGYYSFVENGEL